MPARTITSFSTRWLPILMWIGVSGCADPESTLELRLRSSPSDPEGLAGLELEVAGRTLTVADFDTGPDGVPRTTIQVPNSGVLDGRVTLRQEGITVSEGSFGWEMEPGWTWGADVFRAAEDPTRTCFGCSGHAELSVEAWVAGDAGEAVWVVWGGVPRGSNLVH